MGGGGLGGGRKGVCFTHRRSCPTINRSCFCFSPDHGERARGKEGEKEKKGDLGSVRVKEKKEQDEEGEGRLGAHKRMGNKEEGRERRRRLGRKRSREERGGKKRRG